MQITPSVHALRIPFVIPHPDGARIERFVYVYLIVDDRVTLIDTGVAGAEGAIYAYLRSIGQETESIARIVHTHVHPDHIGATRAIHADSGCEVAIHPKERSWLEDVGLQATERPVPGFQTLVGGSVMVDRIVQEGDRITLGAHRVLQVLDTPGHSKGSISLYLQKEGALFTGDLIPRPNELPIYEHPGETIYSLRKIGTVPGVRVLLSSWDEPRFGGEVRRTIAEGEQYIAMIHRLVWTIRDQHPAADLKELTLLVLENLGISTVGANPLVMTTIAGHLGLRTLSETRFS
jgi:hydroxyacylglutathione hydrolase